MRKVRTESEVRVSALARGETIDGVGTVAAARGGRKCLSACLFETGPSGLAVVYYILSS